MPSSPTDHPPLRGPADIPEKASPSLAYRQGAILVRRLAADFDREHVPHKRALMTRTAMAVMAAKLDAAAASMDEIADQLEAL